MIVTFYIGCLLLTDVMIVFLNRQTAKNYSILFLRDYEKTAYSSSRFWSVCKLNERFGTYIFDERSSINNFLI